jgi:hypothetical protein
MAGPTGDAFGTTSDNGLGSPAAGAASVTLPSTDARQQQASEIMKLLVAARQGFGANNAGGALMPGVMPGTPKLPIPPTPFEEKPVPQAPYASTGARKRADTQALFQSLGKLVNQAEQKHYQMKVQKIQKDFETLSNAMLGYNQGKATGDNAMIEHNAGVINSILGDSKKSKDLAKALDVNLNPMAGGDKKGKDKPNPANDALRAAYAKDLKAYQSGESKLLPQAQAMMRQMPQTLQTDPRYQAYLESVKAGASPKAGEQLTFAKDLLEIQQRISNNQFTNETRNKMAEMFTGARDRATMGAILRTAMNIQGAKDRMDTLEKMWANRADKMYQGIHEKNQVMKDKITASGDADVKRLNALNKGLGQTADSLNKQLEDARKAHDVQKMGEISAKLQSLEYMQQIVNADIAKKLNLNPEDFDQEQFRLDEEMMRQYEALLPDAPPTGSNAADQ